MAKEDGFQLLACPRATP